MKDEQKEIEFPLWGLESMEWWKTATPERVGHLVKQGADVNVRNEWGVTPLHFAAIHNRNPALIDVLVRGCADVNAQDENGFTPLHAAAAYNEFAVIEALVQSGADMNVLDEYGRTPLERAKEWGASPAIIEALMPEVLVPVA